jgi:hypothetical protein
MSSNVNISLTNYRNGTNVSVQRKLVDYAVEWDDDSNVHHTASGTLTFPDILANAALPAGWLQEKLTQLVYEAGRIILGIDTP